MKLRTKIHSKYRISIENTDIFSLLINSEKYKNNKQFIISLLNNKINNQQKEINEVLKNFIDNVSNHYSNKLSFFETSTKQILDYNGEISLLPSWYDENGNINKYYIENIIDDSLNRDLMLLDEQKTIKSNNYRFEILDFNNIFKSLSSEDNHEIIDKKSKLFISMKIIFFILIIIAIILMILFFII